MDKKELPIGVFDSGLGGLSVLRQCIRLMPGENFIYYGDSLHAPYGTKSLEEVRELTMNVADHLFEMGIKGMVVACNTATSAAIRTIRAKYPDAPVVGIEPAIRPAALHHPGKKILVLATPRTLKEEKFLRLKSQYEEIADIRKVPCEGLVELIEQGILSGEPVKHYLTEKLSDYPMEEVGAVVLGCTHYPFIAEALKEVTGPEVEILDGSGGTARQIRRLLKEKNLLSEKTSGGKTVMYNSAYEGKTAFLMEADGIHVVMKEDEHYDLSYQLLKSD